jgi:hypothetical protein
MGVSALFNSQNAKNNFSGSKHDQKSSVKGHALHLAIFVNPLDDVEASSKHTVDDIGYNIDSSSYN